jgi:hypothetical protein
MINEKELNAIKGLLHYLNTTLAVERSANLSFDVKVIDTNGETVARIENYGGDEYQLLFGEG